jgi:hypothetical protein
LCVVFVRRQIMALCHAMPSQDDTCQS